MIYQKMSRLGEVKEQHLIKQKQNYGQTKTGQKIAVGWAGLAVLFFSYLKKPSWDFNFLPIFTIPSSSKMKNVFKCWKDFLWYIFHHTRSIKKFMIKLFWSRMLQWVQMMITVCHIGSIWAFTAKIKELATAISSQESIFPDELRLKSGKTVKTLKSKISNMKIMFQTGERSSTIFKTSTKCLQFSM